MCVIIDRQPGITIPSDKLDLACAINEEGFGLSWIEKGKLVVERDTAKNDPKKIADLLQKLKDQRVYLHLRFATKGEISLENSHPFMVDDVFGFMHNGTLWDWTPDDKKVSDSRYFFDYMLRPQIAMAKRFYGPEFLLKSYSTRQLIKDYCKGMSVFLVFDNLGNAYKYGGGKQFEGFWASNDYSFDPKHHRAPGAKRETPFSTGLKGTRWTKNQSDLPGAFTEAIDFTSRGDPLDFFRQTCKPKSSPDGAQDWSTCEFQAECVGSWITACPAFNTKLLAEKGIEVSVIGDQIEHLDRERIKFLELAKLSSYDDLKHCSDEDIQDMCEQFPKAMAALIVDLLLEKWK